ncbi:MAG TPA: hypothetical protein VNM16_12790 [Bacillota bacterium]|nr:hypothetical protein [Bacillota bacterium]
MSSPSTLAAGEDQAFWTADKLLVDALGADAPAWVHALAQGRKGCAHAC